MKYKVSSYIFKTFDGNDMIIKSTLSQKVLRIKGNMIETVNELLDKGDFEADVLDEKMQVLYNSGFIIEADIDEAEIVNYYYNSEVYENNRLELTIIPTNACNFNCAYCYQKEPYFYMSDITARSIILYIEKNLHKYDGLLISWFGGEPLLEKNLIITMMEQIRAVCRKHKKPLYSSITTNGYELDESTFSSLIKTHLRFYQVTLDGPKQIHNRLRPHKMKDDSFDMIVKNLFTIKEKFSKYKFIIALRINVSSQTLPFLNEHIDWLTNNFANDPHFTIVWEYVRDWGGEKIDKNRNLLLNNKESYEWLKKLSEKGFTFNSGFDRNDRSSAICTASKRHGFVVNYDGYVYKCAMVMDSIQYKNINCIGKITENGIMQLHIGKMSKWLGRLPDKKCIACVHYPECMGATCPLNTKILRYPSQCDELFKNDFQYIYKNKKSIANAKCIEEV